jgi:hypothetical protein
MASAIYPFGKQAFLSATLNLLTDTVMVALIDTTAYTYNAAHQYWSSASAGAIGTPVQLTTVTVDQPTPGTFDAADATFTSVTGNTVSAIIIYKSTGTASTSPLIAYIDGVSVTPNGGNIIASWDNTANRIFGL